MKEILEDLSIKHSGNWELFIRKVSEYCKDTLLTYNDFNRILDGVRNHPKSLLSGISISVSADKIAYPPYTIGNEIDSLPSISENFNMDSHDCYHCYLQLWVKPTNNERPSISSDEMKGLIKNLILVFWKAGLRDGTTNIISELIGDTKALVRHTIDVYARHNKYITFYFSDLDKFKEINSLYGQANGDSVILQMAVLFDHFIQKQDGILIHRSGDEFIFVSFYDKVEKALSFAYQLHLIVRNTSFKVSFNGEEIEVRKSITIGIKTCPIESDYLISYDENIKDAEDAMKDESGAKRYDTANFWNARVPSSATSALDEHSLNIAKILIKTCSFESVFKNVWLNLISYFVFQAHIAGKNSSETIDLLKWIDVNRAVICNAALVNNNIPDYSKDNSCHDILFAIARGRFYYESLHEDEVKISYEISNDGSDLVLRDTDSVEDIVKIDNCGTNLPIKIGSAFSGRLNSPALLIKIGHREVAFPKQIFADIIIVDDRPSRGGGLPDFWEATIARLINTLNTNSNVSKIYILGDGTYGQKTIETISKLTSEGLGIDNLEEIAYKIGTTNQFLRNARDHSLIADNVEITDSILSLIQSYSNSITDGSRFALTEVTQTDSAYLKFLEKQLHLDRYALSNEDGFRVDTLSEAFPLMLEIARKASLHKQILDQAGVKLGELIDFKVELSNPLKNSIPLYYQKESKDFEKYYQNQFLDESGLFAKHLTQQLKTVLGHVADAISNSTHQYATRRAILIIPNNVGPHNELSPLGLISIRIIPRFDSSGRTNLSYSFTWRTVEALVGFPYSFYGSIRYSDYLTSRIIGLLPPNKFEVSFDKISYIAHSLHIFMDDFGQNIAKRIADDASI